MIAAYMYGKPVSFEPWMILFYSNCLYCFVLMFGGLLFHLYRYTPRQAPQGVMVTFGLSLMLALWGWPVSFVINTALCAAAPPVGATLTSIAFALFSNFSFWYCTVITDHTPTY